MNAVLPLPAIGFSLSMQREIRRAWPMGLIVLLHAGAFYLLQSRLTHTPVQASPREIVATLIAAEPAVKPVVSAPAPVPPKSVPTITKAASPPKPAPATSKSETAIATAAPTSSPQAAEPVTAAAEPQAAAAPTAVARPKTVSGVEYIHAPRPAYPPLSRRAEEQGKVILRVLVDQKGRPERAEVQKSSGFTRLDDAAIAAVMQQALFKPHLEDGRPVSVYALVPINFSIQ